MKKLVSNGPLSTSLFKSRTGLYPKMEASPHLQRAEPSSQRIMADVLIALLPAICGSVYLFGFAVLPYYFVSIICAVAASCAALLLRKQPLYLDLSAVVTGTLLAMSLPASAPVWYCALGAVFGILVGKELFGGLGRNFLNPALTGRALLRLVFAGEILKNPIPAPPFAMLPPVDGVAGATTLMLVKEGTSPTTGQLWQAFVGNVPGKLGETSALLLLLGAAYLVARGVIRLRIPLTMLGTIAAIAFVFGGPGGLFSATPAIVLGHLLGGASILGAFYMATDYGSSPSSPAGQTLFAIFLSVNIMLWRFLSPYAEGFTFALLTANLLVPLLNRFVRPRVLGEKRFPRKRKT